MTLRTRAVRARRLLPVITLGLGVAATAALATDGSNQEWPEWWGRATLLHSGVPNYWPCPAADPQCTKEPDGSYDHQVNIGESGEMPRIPPWHPRYNKTDSWNEYLVEHSLLPPDSLPGGAQFKTGYYRLFATNTPKTSLAETTLHEFKWAYSPGKYVTADLVQMIVHARCDGSWWPTLEVTHKLVGLAIDGTPVSSSAAPAPNTVVPLGDVGQLVLNEHRDVTTVAWAVFQKEATALHFLPGKQTQGQVPELHFARARAGLRCW